MIVLKAVQGDLFVVMFIFPIMFSFTVKVNMYQTHCTHAEQCEH